MKKIFSIVLCGLLLGCANSSETPERLKQGLSTGSSGLTAWVSFEGQPCIAVDLHVLNSPDFGRTFSHSATKDQLIGKHKINSVPEAKILLAKIPPGRTVLKLGCLYRTVTNTNESEVTVTTQKVEYSGWLSDDGLTNREIDFVAPEGKVVDLGVINLFKQTRNCELGCVGWEHKRSDDTRKAALASVLGSRGILGSIVELQP